jgi:hypothetical protein
MTHLKTPASILFGSMTYAHPAVSLAAPLGPMTLKVNDPIFEDGPTRRAIRNLMLRADIPENAAKTKDDC